MELTGGREIEKNLDMESRMNVMILVGNATEENLLFQKKRLKLSKNSLKTIKSS